MHIRKNDIVYVRAGKDKGKKAKVLKVFPARLKALVEGINYVKKHTRRTQQDQKGGVIQRENPISVSSLAVICPKCAKPVRVGFKEMADRTKARVCRKCGEII
jgi:large subunit ribosomal protein L24